MKEIELSKDQKEVFDFIIERVGNGRAVTSFGGFAGTGKTTLITKISSYLRKKMGFTKFGFVSFTGKAASVLKNKLEFESLIDNDSYKDGIDYVGTIHSLIYHPDKVYSSELKKFIIKGWKKKSKSALGIYNLLIIDEASMLSDYILEDLKTYGIPILAIGDHNQIPPVSKSQNNIIQNPDITLTKIHRQCENSPIIKLSKFVRENGYIPNNTIFDKNVFKIDWRSNQCKNIWNNINFDSSTVCLCAFNNSRVYLNHIIRERFGYENDYPYPNERIICLKNDHKLGIMNGQMATLIWSLGVDKTFMKLTLDVDGYEDNYIDCLSYLPTFNEPNNIIYDLELTGKEKRIIQENNFDNVNFFDYGYCISTHKSQGSEFDRVILFEQRTNKWDDDYYAKWLYTAVTRAKTKLMVISNFY